MNCNTIKRLVTFRNGHDQVFQPPATSLVLSAVLHSFYDAELKKAVAEKRIKDAYGRAQTLR